MSRLCLLTVLSIGLVLASLSAEDKKPQTINGWGSVVDPDGDCRVTEENGKVTITVPGTYHDLTHSEGRDKLNSPRVLQEVKGDFVVQVKVNAFPVFAENTSTSLGICFNSSGLLIWQDEKNFIRLDRAAESGRPFVWVERFEDGKPVTQKLEEIADNSTYLRFTRSGTKLTYESSADGTTWSQIEAEDATLPATVKVGVLAINTTTREFAPQLEGLTVTAK
jgi:regulation of enolase protein 1 (concanavalin A-like superfamily)